MQYFCSVSKHIHGNPVVMFWLKSVSLPEIVDIFTSEPFYKQKLYIELTEIFVTGYASKPDDSLCEDVFYG